MIFVDDFTVENDSKHSAEVLSRDPKCKNTVMCLMEKTCVLDKLTSGKGIVEGTSVMYSGRLSFKLLM